MSYTQMNAKFNGLDDTVSNKSLVAGKVDEDRYFNVVQGTLDWNDSTQAGVYPILDANGNPLVVPSGAVVESVLLKQVGSATSGVQLLAGAATALLFVTNKLTSSGAYQTVTTAGQLTPFSLGVAATSATSIGMGAGGTGYFNVGSLPVPNKLTTDVIQPLVLCASVNGAATNKSSKLQVVVRLHL